MHLMNAVRSTSAPALVVSLLGAFWGDPVLFAESANLFAGSAHATTAPPKTVQFRRDVAPILARTCFTCHGPDARRRRARLRLDQESGIRKVFVPAKLEDSEAWIRITSDDPDERMPPADSHLELKPEEIKLLRRWIEEGAEWQGHWAFNPPARPAAPSVKRPEWVRSPIDAFILARLEREGLAPTKEAGRERLIRRLSFDLTGLPPSLEEIDRFVSDGREDAYELLVDRLLASPHYGERMTLAWMDLARYGDTSVFHADGPRNMWAWRDWVIGAYNDNKPFDQFTIEQLAGDLLPDATVEQKIATAFNRNNATTDEGGAIAEEFRVEYAVDRVKTTSLVWLALSMECGQCHSHKYDPISQKEYYQFYAFFNQAADPGMQTRRGNQSPLVDVPNYSLRRTLPALRGEEKRIETLLGDRRKAAEGEYQTWLAKAEATAGEEQEPPPDPLVHFTFDATEGKVAKGRGASKDGASKKDASAAGEARELSGQLKGNASWQAGRLGRAIEVSGKGFVDLGNVADFERTDSFSYGAWVKPKGQPTGAPLARMDEGSGYRGYDLHLDRGRVQVHLVHQWPGAAIKVKTKAKIKKDAWQHVFVTYDGSSRAAGVKVFIDGKAQELEVEQNGLKATMRTKRSLYVGRRHSGQRYQGLVDELRIYDRQLTPAEVARLAGQDQIGPLLAKERAARTEKEAQTIRTHYLETVDKEYRRLAKELAGAKARVAKASAPLTSVMIMQDVPKPRPTYVLMRGNYASPMKERPVEPGVPAFLPSLAKDAPRNRLGLARWLVARDHPLTARVAINRYWYLLFGTGIVKSLENFGTQGELPSHPALLDWLAIDFMENGWNVKRAIKQMVMSATYRQSSRISPEGLKRDPENRLLGRGPRFRLTGEFVRDNALVVGGLLVRTIGGAGVKPYQPPGLWNEVSLSANVRFVQDHGEKLYRRSMYTYWKRSAPAPSLTIFDTPTREKCVMRRSRTNTPLQALVTMNDPQFVEAARALARRAMREGGKTPGEWITYAHRLATALRPRASTLALLERTYREELAVFQGAEDRARGLLSVGESKVEETIDAAEHAAMTIVASMILNLNATLTRG